MVSSELEVSIVKEFNIYQSLKAGIQNLGKNFEIILWKGSFFNKVAG